MINQLINIDNKYNHWRLFTIACAITVSIFLIFHMSIDGYFVKDKVWVASWSKWFGGIIALALLVILAKKRDSAVKYNPLDYAFFALTTYLALSSLWNPDLHNAYVTISYFGCIIFAYCAWRHLTFDDLILYLEIFSILFAVGLAIAILLTQSGFLPNAAHLTFGNRNFAVEITTMMVPISFYFIWKYKISLPAISIRCLIHLVSFIFLLGFIALYRDSNAALIGLAVILLGALLHYNNITRIVAVIIMLSALAFIFLYIPHLIEANHDGLLGKIARSFHHRFQIWLASLAIFPQFPIFGTGVGGYSYYYPNTSLNYYEYAPFLGMPLDMRFFNPGQVHNEFMQILIEGGIVGFLLLIIFAVIFTKYFIALSRQNMMMVLGIFAVFGVSMISFPLQRFEGIAIFLPLLAFMASAIDNDKLYKEKNKTITLPKMPTSIMGMVAGAFFMASFIISFQATQSWTHYTYVLVQSSKNKLQGLSITNLQAILNWPLLGPRFDLFHLFIQSFPPNILPQLNREEVDFYYRLTSSATPNVPHNLIARLNYLYALGAKQEDLKEILNLLERLEQVSGRIYSWSYTKRAHLAVIQKDYKTAANYHNKALSVLAVDESDRQILAQLKNIIESQ